MFRCAFYEKEITPPLESIIPGYFTPRVATEVLDRLYVKAAVFENDGNAVAIISADSCGLYPNLCNKIVERVERMTGIPAENVMVCATHTHTGIPSGGSSVYKGDDIYLDVFCRLAADCVTLAYQNLVPATLKYAKPTVEGINFVRNYRMKDGTVRTNPGYGNPDILEHCDKADPDFPVLIAYDENNKPLGSVSNFACHLDCVTSFHQLSGDYASVISYKFKEQFGNDFVSVFVMGPAGNVIEVNYMLAEKLPTYNYVCFGETLAKEAIKVIPEAVEIKNPKISSKKKVFMLKRRRISEEQLKIEKDLASRKEVIYATSTDRSLGVRNRGYIAQRIIYQMEDKTKYAPFVLQVITIGECKFYGIAAEVYAKFGREIKENAPTDKVFIATLANGFNGYIPTPDLYKEEDMYETKISQARFDSDTGDKIVSTLKEMQ